MAGEPIIVQYDLRNETSSTWINTRLDRYVTNWYSAQLIDPSGSMIKPKPQLQSLWRQGGAYSGPGAMFSPAERRTGYIYCNQLFDFTKPGHYKLNLNVSLPYADLGNDRNSFGDVASITDRSSLRVSDKIALDIIVTRADPDKLHHLARSLRMKCFNATTAVDRTYELQSFLSLPSGDAARYWRSLAMDPTVPDRYEIAEALAATGSHEAAGIILDMEQNCPVIGTDGQPISVMHFIRYMHDVGDDATKTYIDKQLAKRHMSVNNIPIDID